ncbi:MAG: CRISPR-associated protein Cas4 [Raoultibacter sp.]
MYTDDDLLGLAGLQHLAFCERQWALIHLECQWADSYDTARGDIFHERAHLEGYSSRKSVRSERGFRLVSYRLGLLGVADIVEFVEDDQGVVLDGGGRYRLMPVEYKVGKPKIEDWDRIQICAQALCLEEMFGCAIPEGNLFYGETRRRERIALDGDLRDRVEAQALRMHQLFDARAMPRAAKSARCKRCSLIDICLPEMFSEKAGEYWEAEGFVIKEAIA